MFGDFQSLKSNPGEHRIQPIEASQLGPPAPPLCRCAEHPTLLICERGGRAVHEHTTAESVLEMRCATGILIRGAVGVLRTKGIALTRR